MKPRCVSSRIHRVLITSFAAIMLVVWSGVPLLAQGESILAPPDRSSPQDWIVSFLGEAESFEAAWTSYRSNQTRANFDTLADRMEVLRSFFDLSEVPAAFRAKVGGEAATEMADILHRLPLDLIMSSLGDTTGTAVAPDQWTIPATEIVLVRQKDGMEAGNYLLPHDVIVRLPAFHEKILDAPLLQETAYGNLRSEQMQTVGPLVPIAVVNTLPSWLKRPLFGTPVWKQVVAVCFFIFLLSLNVAWARLVKRSNGHFPEAIRGLLNLSRPAFFAAGFLVFHQFIELQLNVQGFAALASLLIRNLALIAAAAWFVWSAAMVTGEAMIRFEALPEERLDAHLTRLISQLIGAVGVAAVIVFGLGSIGIPAAGLITGIGVGGVGIALAARETIGNIFGGIVLLMDRPFRVGDWIEAGDKSGHVVDIGPRSCRLRTADSSIVVIPNGPLSTQPITNLGLAPKHIVKQVLPLPAGISRAEVEAKLSDVRAVLGSIGGQGALASRPLARLSSAADGTAQIEVEISLDASGSADVDPVRTELMMALLEVAVTASDHIQTAKTVSQPTTV